MTIFEISSIVISLAAIGFVIFQSNAIIKHNKISIKPLVGLHVDTTKDGEILITMKNDGLGTAILRKLTIFINGIPAEGKSHISSVIHKVLEDSRASFGIPHYYHIIDETGLATLAKDKEIVFLKLVFYDAIADTDIDALRSVSVEIEYESLYGERQTPFSTKHITDWI